FFKQKTTFFIYIFSLSTYFEFTIYINIFYLLILSIFITLFVLSSISNIQELNLPFGSGDNLYLSGSDVSNLLKDTSTSIPITDLFGPVIPISVIYPVPFSNIVSSAV